MTNSAQAASPFHTLLKNSFLQPFVRTIAIHAIPFVRQRPSPAFLLDLCKLLPKLKNLSSFAYTVPTLMALFPPMLPGLVANHNLKELKIMGEHVGSVQAELLTKVGKGKTQALSTKKEGGLAGTSVLQRGEDTTGEETPADTYVGSILPKPHGLEKLWIKSPSPSIMYRLETWVEGNKDTLKSLCILVRFDPSIYKSYVKTLSDLKFLTTGCAYSINRLPPPTRHLCSSSYCAHHDPMSGNRSLESLGDAGTFARAQESVS